MWRPVRRAATWSAMAGGLLVAVALLADEPYGRHQLDPAVCEHWSFQSVRRPAVPAIGGQWGRNPIDAFILAGLKDSQLTPADPADRATLLRRVYLDLVGLPPTPAELDAFLADASPDAYECVVDDLLARPQFGERWARHWLDVVRYAETNGYERDGLKPQAWRYRDWVIDAFNADMPYNQFLTEQLAGDEIEASDARSQTATTMLRLGPWDDEPADPLVDRYDQLDDIVGTTSATFLGLTLRCARCHDHKFEPFSQKDYTRWQAIFAPLKRPQKDRADLDRDLGPHAEVEAYHARLKQLDGQSAELASKIALAEYQISQRLASDASMTVVAATSQTEGQSWRYTFDDPSSSSWVLPEFDDSGWKSGEGGFGTKGTPGAVVRTDWNTPAIWLRREFMASAVPMGQLKLLVEHDDDFEVFINGVRAAGASGFTTEYREFDVAPEAKAALRQGATCWPCTAGKPPAARASTWDWSPSSPRRSTSKRHWRPRICRRTSSTRCAPIRPSGTTPRKSCWPSTPRKSWRW